MINVNFCYEGRMWLSAESAPEELSLEAGYILSNTALSMVGNLGSRIQFKIDQSNYRPYVLIEFISFI